MKTLACLLALLPCLAFSQDFFRPEGARTHLVKFRPNVGLLSRVAMIRSEGFETGRIEKLKIHTVVANPGRLRAMSGVEWVEENRECPPAGYALIPRRRFTGGPPGAVPWDSLTLIPNDVEYASQFHYWSQKVNLPLAWDIQTQGVPIAILDSGIANHADLRQSQGVNLYDGNSDTSDITGHGTGVAGLAGAIGNNSIGIAGASWSSVVPVRIVNPATGGAPFSLMAQGLVWAADQGIRVANISYGGTHGSLAVSDAARYFQSKGGIVVVGSGNTFAYDSAPDNPYMLRVGGTDNADIIAGFSTYGPSVDVVAPGQNVRTTMRNGGYGNGSGTSFASPIVAGIASLILAKNPTYTGSQVQAILKSTARDLGSPGRDDWYGWGIVDAYRALTASAEPPEPTDTQPPFVQITSPLDGSTVKGNGSVSVKVTATDNVSVASVKFFLNGALRGTLSQEPYTWSVSAKQFSNGTNVVLVTARDGAGNEASHSVKVIR